MAFVWDQNYQKAFDDLKRTLVGAPILVRPDFKEPFCLDVDWSTRGVVSFYHKGRADVRR